MVSGSFGILLFILVFHCSSYFQSLWFLYILLLKEMVRKSSPWQRVPGPSLSAFMLRWGGRGRLSGVPWSWSSFCPVLKNLHPWGPHTPPGTVRCRTGGPFVNGTNTAAQLAGLQVRPPGVCVLVCVCARLCHSYTPVPWKFPCFGILWSFKHTPSSSEVRLNRKAPIGQ